MLGEPLPFYMGFHFAPPPIQFHVKFLAIQMCRFALPLLLLGKQNWR